MTKPLIHRSLCPDKWSHLNKNVSLTIACLTMEVERHRNVTEGFIVRETHLKYVLRNKSFTLRFESCGVPQGSLKEHLLKWNWLGLCVKMINNFLPVVDSALNYFSSEFNSDLLMVNLNATKCIAVVLKQLLIFHRGSCKFETFTLLPVALHCCFGRNIIIINAQEVLRLASVASCACK